MLDGLTGELNPRQLRYLTRLQANTDRLARLINDLLDLSGSKPAAWNCGRPPCGWRRSSTTSWPACDRWRTPEVSSSKR